jgi:hypothetical protein
MGVHAIRVLVVHNKDGHSAVWLAESIHSRRSENALEKKGLLWVRDWTMGEGDGYDG